ncbi:MAG: ABC transporter permease [Ottowia sp.]|uniref:ABC transporter permease n=1 Tax=Ottowia sp. TaxID=1898956 RepID=UPI003C74F474
MTARASTTPISAVNPAAASAEAAAQAPALRRHLPRHTGLLTGGLLFALIALAALAAPLLGLADPYAGDLAARQLPPIWEDGGTWAHLFGTDHLGRDLLTRLVYGARISLLVGVTVALVAGTIGTVLGVLAGYFGGWVDTAINFLITTRLAMPLVLVALAVVNVFGPSLKIVVGVLGLLLWDRFAVVARSATQQVRSLEYVQAARAVGCGPMHIVFREILPNISGPLLVVATLEMAHAILLEAALSFLGLGVPAPLPAWGLMIAEGKDMMFFSSYLIAVPGAALFVLVLAINLLGDGLRDVTAARGRN